MRATILVLLLAGSAIAAQTLNGQRIGCVAVRQAEVRSLIGLKKVHAVACFETSTGEGLILVLRKDGKVACTGSGFLLTDGSQCADVTVCGRRDTFCLF